MENLFDFMDSCLFWIPVISGYAFLMTLAFISKSIDLKRSNKEKKLMDHQMQNLFDEQYNLRKQNVKLQDTLEILTKNSKC